MTLTEVDLEGKVLLGFDFSTQQVKAIAVSRSLEVLALESVHFDTDLPEYRTHGGVHTQGTRVTAPTIMWVKALDILMEKIRISGIDFADVVAISGCAQSHGSVFWRTGAESMLTNANPDKFLHDQLAHAFAILDSPVWMDGSTGQQCKEIEEKIGRETLLDITGSTAHERFTAAQIRKIYEEKPEAYSNTERISLVSSFACSLFLGKYAPIDLADGGGMNLLDIWQKKWSPQCLEACSPDLLSKLGSEVVPSSTIVGSISAYMAERYGFDPEICKVCAFTGDNQSSLVGLMMGPGDIGISLGTSDTVFVWFDCDPGDESSRPKPQLSGGHLWPNPADKNSYMALLCYKNGSLTRERICQEAAEDSWDLFGQLLDSTPRGNFGNIGVYFDHPEITPNGLQGDFRFNKGDERVARFASKEAEVRALVEGQFLAKRWHAEQMGFQIGKDSRLLVCGGASENKAILQVIADVFNAPVYTQNFGSNCAALGSAMRALHSVQGGEDFLSITSAIRVEDEHEDGEQREKKRVGKATLVCKPQKDAASVYKPIMERYRSVERRLMNK